MYYEEPESFIVMILKEFWKPIVIVILILIIGAIVYFGVPSSYSNHYFKIGFEKVDDVYNPVNTIIGRLMEEVEIVVYNDIQN